MKQMVVVVGMVFLFSACGESVAERACKRDDECNFLAPGISVQECIDEVENQLEMLTEAQRNDIERIIESCLEFETCSAYSSCLNE